MSEYKVSYKLLAQQADDLLKVSSQLTTYSDQLSAIVPKLGEDELLQQLKTNINELAASMAESAELTSIAGNTLKESVEEYSNTEVKLVQHSEGTKAHSRDFYKNPVSVGGGGASVARNMGTRSAGSIDASGSYAYEAPTGAYATGGSYGSGAASGLGAGVTAAGASVVAGVGAAAVGAGAILGAKHIIDKKKAKKQTEGANANASAPVNNASFEEASKSKNDYYNSVLELEEAKNKLESLNSK